MNGWISLWFQWVHDWGYPGIIVLMALESSVFPIPSEIVIPPAAYWATQGRYSLGGVVLAGTAGSYLGAAATYWAARWLGRPLLVRYGKYMFCPEAKLLRAERWLARYEAGGVFFARLVPVVRHLIGIPAGLVRMPFGTYSLMTILGAGLWCWVLAWFGGNLLGDQPDLIQDPARLVHVMKERSYLVGGFALLLCLLYVLVMRLTAKPAPADAGRSTLGSDRCPRCGGEVDQEKTTFTGEEIREYSCRACGWNEIVRCGPALWQILHDANEEAERRRKGNASQSDASPRPNGPA